MSTGPSGSRQGPSPALEQLIGKALTNSEFRQKLVEDPEEAVRSAGLALSPEELQTLQGMSLEHRQQTMDELGERISPIQRLIAR